MGNKKIILSEEQLRAIICGAISQDNNLLEYARVGYIGKNNDLEVYVMTDDPGYVPHFHIRDVKTRGSEFDTCIEIGRSEYFLHGHHKCKLNSNGRKELAEFMKSACPNAKYETNYELVVDMWNMNNSNMLVEYTGKENIPDYNQLK